jgi:lipoate-protein ligase A
MSEKREGTPLTPEEWHEKMKKKREKLKKPLPKETLTPEEWKEKKREEREKAKKRLPDETDIYEA